jgi:hypothetical protein
MLLIHRNVNILFVLFLFSYGTIGIYAVMFFSVLKTLIKVAVFFMILMAAFTVTFYQLLPILIFPDNPEFYDVQVRVYMYMLIYLIIILTYT